MTPAEIRLRKNEVLSSLLGRQQGTFIAERVLPRLPSALSGFSIPQVGDERLRRYNLRRAPGTQTKRIDVKIDGRVYSVDRDAVEVAVPRELIREAEFTNMQDVALVPDLVKMAVATASEALAVAYELEAASVLTNPANYALGHVVTFTADRKWNSGSLATSVSDINEGKSLIRKKIGRQANTLSMSFEVFTALTLDLEVRSYLPDEFTGTPGIEELKAILALENIEVGDASWIDENNVFQDVWGNYAVLSYVPKFSADGADFGLGEPAFGFTGVMEGHPTVENPWYSERDKTWVLGATYERRPLLASNTAAVLFVAPR